MSRDELVETLATLDYGKPERIERAEEERDLVAETYALQDDDGSFDEVVIAYARGGIDPDTYFAVLERIHELGSGEAERPSLRTKPTPVPPSPSVRFVAETRKRPLRAIVSRLRRWG